MSSSGPGPGLEESLQKFKREDDIIRLAFLDESSG